MIVELEPRDFERVWELFQELDFHLAVPAILGKSISGKVYVDDATDPRSSFAWTNGRIHLAGDPRNEAFNQAAGRLFTGTIFPQAKAARRVALSLVYDREGWEAAIAKVILKGMHPYYTQREYYTYQQLKHDWRAMLTGCFQLHSVGPQLLADRQLRNLERLEAELCSERESVAAFLDKSFGVCLVHENTIAAWCLSEYNHDMRCEIGIETVEAYQRRGFATLTASALIEHVQVRGVRKIGWHCSAGNIASGAAARKIGFQKVRDYSAYVVWLSDPEGP